MLKTLDMLISFATVMLLFSLIVTILTQFASSVLNLRGEALKRGLSGLLMQLDRGIGPKDSAAIADAILKHPLVASSAKRLGAVIHREEFTNMLLLFAADEGAAKLTGSCRTALINALAANGISDPAKTLNGIRDVALRLEQEHPELAEHERKTMAVLAAGSSTFVAKVHSWFDQTIDRVSDRFQGHAQIVTIIAALLIAAVVQLDTLALANRLSVDEAFRSALVKQAEQITPTTAGDPSAATVRDQVFGDLAKRGLIWTPFKSGKTLRECFLEWMYRWQWPMVPGFLMSVFLLSLGAPFWYDTLKKLISVRSTIAQKDDAERTDRQTNQAAVSPGDVKTAVLPNSSPSAPVLSGEHGDLSPNG